MDVQRVIALSAATEARYRARTAKRDRKWREFQTGDLTGVETPRRITLRAARLGVSPDRALELMEPVAISADPTELGFERVLGRRDFVALDYLERGLRAARAVCRIVIRSGSTVVGFGTGFLIAPRVLITNNHVLGSTAEAGGSLAEFNFQRRLDGSPERAISFSLRPQELFVTDAALDFSIVAVAESSGPDRVEQFGFLPLIAAEGKVNISEAVSIIQHPDGQEKQLALRENQVIDLLESFIHYKTDTAPGSSGSPVFNDQWEVVGLHHSGVPERDAQGRILAMNDKPWRPEMGEALVKWIANEGARASRIVAQIENANLRAEQRSLLATDPREAFQLTQPTAAVDGRQVVASADDGQLTMRIPLTVSVRMALGDRPERRDPEPPPAQTVQVAAAVGIDAAVQQARELLSGVEEVVSVRKGWKFRNGWITDERAVVVQVRDKLPEATLRERGREPLPTTIGAFSVDVRPATPLDRLGNEGLALAGRFSLEALRRPRIRYKGPAGAEGLLAPVRERMGLIAHVSPDAGFPQLSAFIGRTDRTFNVAMFDFGAPHIVAALTARLKSKPRRMQITIQPGESLGGKTKAKDLPDAKSLERLRKAMGTRFRSSLIKPSTAGGYVASSYHIKVAVRDSAEAWVSSGNWQSSNQPNLPSSTTAQKRHLLNNFNREWHVIVDGARTARALKAFLDHDFTNGPSPEDFEGVSVPLVELPDALLPPALEAAKVVRLFEPLALPSQEIDVQLALTPDNYSDVVLRLLEGAREQILFENQSFKLLEENDERFEALAAALLAKQRAGLDVRIIFRDIGDVQTSLERMKDFGFDMRNVRLHPHCHTKGIVVDQRRVLVGSHNWTNHGAVFNRDASLLIAHPDVARYFEELFLFDWENMSRQKTVFEEWAAKLVTPDQARKSEGRVVSLAEYLGEE